MIRDPREFAGQLTRQVAACCDGALSAAYLHGSAALGGWTAQRSDVDILFIAADDIPARATTAIADVLTASASRCPGRGLECSVVTAGAALRPAPPWPFIVHVGFGQAGLTLSWCIDAAGDRDLLMHYEVCRAAGIALLGPPPGDLIGQVPRPAVLAYLADELGWGLANAAESYAVLNACRALAFLADGQIVSKVAGGLAAIDAGRAPAALVRRALAQQQAISPEAAPGPEAIDFVRTSAAALRAAAEREAGHQPA